MLNEDIKQYYEKPTDSEMLDFLIEMNFVLWNMDMAIG